MFPKEDPETDIVRRYYKGINMLFSHYFNLADTAEVYDNSFGTPSLVAEKRSITSSWSIHQPKIWQNLQDMHNEK